ncbi:hypothetical protein OG594_23385 [Streptomyces sp. NBC_01214]|nr:hypothetical protein [Streptomyces sp. NBC_01214]MCX4804537.1 hypothetical protein [Streptomyces sp. NBC_01214]
MMITIWSAVAAAVVAVPVAFAFAVQACHGDGDDGWTASGVVRG